MAKMKLSSKMHVMIIVSALIIAIGLAMGLVGEFVLNGYFNYGEEYSSYNSVVVNYAYVDLSGVGGEDGVKTICDEEFSSAGVGYFTSTKGDTNGGGEYVFKFSVNADAESVKKAAEAINVRLNTAKDGYSPSSLSNAYFHEVATEKGGRNVYVYGSIALASAMVFQFLYFVIRYRLTMALSALLANVHNIAIFVSLTAITRVPVGSSVFTFGVLTVLATMIGCCFLFDKMRKNFKKESFEKQVLFDRVDACANESFVSIAFTSVCIAVAAAVVFALLAVSSFSVALVVTPAALALISAASSLYGTAFFTPAVYSRFKLIGDEFKANRAAKKKADKKA